MTIEYQHHGGVATLSRGIPSMSRNDVDEVKKPESKIKVNLISLSNWRYQRFLTARISERTVAIGSRCNASTNEVGWAPSGGTYSSAVMTEKSIRVIASTTALHARFTTCGKHLSIVPSVSSLRLCTERYNHGPNTTLYFVKLDAAPAQFTF